MEKEGFITPDLDEGAVFLTTGEKYLRTKRSENGYISFEFEHSPTIDQTHRDYLSGNLTLPTNILFVNLRKMRSIYLRAKREVQ